MTEEQFKIYVLRIFDRALNVMSRKQNEYVLDKTDRFKAFKHEWLNSQIKENPKLVLWHQMAKHLDSIFDMCNSKLKFNFDVWDEKIIDVINYLCILSAMVKEEN